MKNLIYISIISLFLLACAGKGGDPEPEVVIPAPAKATLSFPAKDAVCTTGTVLSASQNSVTFTWNTASNTDSYDLILKNLITGVSTTQTTTAVQLTITLATNTPYSWSITSKSTASPTATQSEIWKFYSAGTGITSYPPFPADITAPVLGQNLNATNGKINLTWTGNDVDNDITGYDIYFGETTSPALLQGNVTNSFLNDVSITANKTYYWKVVTKDAAGNSSSSVLSQFKIN
jgi:hypothetical protein